MYIYIYKQYENRSACQLILLSAQKLDALFSSEFFSLQRVFTNNSSQSICEFFIFILAVF